MRGEGLSSRVTLESHDINGLRFRTSNRRNPSWIEGLVARLPFREDTVVD